jgi:enamine deaminase RidA (YjgF/YER057c/UK114 family)
MNKNERSDLVLPEPPRPLGQYSTVSEANGLVFLSGMLPIREGKMVFTGLLDKEQAREAARIATLNALAVLNDHFGSLQKVRRAVQVAVYVAAAPGFYDHAYVADGSSQILNSIFPDKHSRLVFGVSSLPMNASVELGLIFQTAGNK